LRDNLRYGATGVTGENRETVKTRQSSGRRCPGGFNKPAQNLLDGLAGSGHMH
jgi:hypothetical protein